MQYEIFVKANRLDGDGEVMEKEERGFRFQVDSLWEMDAFLRNVHANPTAIILSAYDWRSPEKKVSHLTVTELPREEK